MNKDRKDDPSDIFTSDSSLSSLMNRSQSLYSIDYVDTLRFAQGNALAYVDEKPKTISAGRITVTNPGIDFNAHYDDNDDTFDNANDNDYGMPNSCRQTLLTTDETLADFTKLLTPLLEVMESRPQNEQARFMQEYHRRKLLHLSDYMPLTTFPNQYENDIQGVDHKARFVSDKEAIIVEAISSAVHPTIAKEFMRAGPRSYQHFQPKQTKAALVVCGGLCPGINTVIRELYIMLKDFYRVDEIYGVQYGFRGFYDPFLEIKKLHWSNLRSIHHQGGSIIGSSREPCNIELVCSSIIDYGFNQIYIIGDDKVQNQAWELVNELVIKQKRMISIIGIPKSIDNDIPIIDKSFGFDTAVEEAQRCIKSAKVEASNAINGIGMVKLFGHQSGYISMYASMASREVDVCLIPEIPFDFASLMDYITELFQTKGHCVLVICDGTGPDLQQEYKNTTGQQPDIGIILRDKINAYMKRHQIEVNLKYIDPTYMIRTVVPNASDNLYCANVAQNAVHEAFCGYSGVAIGLVNSHYVMIPMVDFATQGRLKVNLNSRMWHRVIATTGQPALTKIQ